MSELRKRQPHPNLLAWYSAVMSADLFLSVLTLGEVRLGIERLRRRDAPRAERLERWLQGLELTYQERIVGIDAATAREWGRLNCPDPLPVIDSLLAASARARGWTLVTRNTRDLARTGARLLNPFEATHRLP